jgi:Ca2+-binding RTX toxin-like protein
MRALRCIVAAAAALACVPSTALAAKAEVVTTRIPCPHALCDYYTQSGLVFRAAPGEANAVAITSDGQRTTFTDTGAPVEAGAGCERVDDHSARCPGTSASVDAGDGADTIVVGAVTATSGWRLLGGPGDDAITGGPGGDTLDGGKGHDRLDGGAGNDTVTDADGAAQDHDVLAGGAGNDSLDYTGHTVPLVVYLPTQATDTGDDISGFENVSGGRSEDALTALPTGSRLYGGPGEDSLKGGPGADEIDGGSGDDSVSAGAGDDEIDSRDGRAELVFCGAGRDRVTGYEIVDDDYEGLTTRLAGPDARDVLDRTCELAEAGDEELPVPVPPIAAGTDRLVLRKPCRRCIGRVTVRAGGHRIGTERLREGHTTVTVRLTRRLPRGRIELAWRYGVDFADIDAAFSVVLRE